MTTVRGYADDIVDAAAHLSARRRELQECQDYLVAAAESWQATDWEIVRLLRIRADYTAWEWTLPDLDDAIERENRRLRVADACVDDARARVARAQLDVEDAAMDLARAEGAE